MAFSVFISCSFASDSSRPCFGAWRMGPYPLQRMPRLPQSGWWCAIDDYIAQIPARLQSMKNWIWTLATSSSSACAALRRQYLFRLKALQITQMETLQKDNVPLKTRWRDVDVMEISKYALPCPPLFLGRFVLQPGIIWARNETLGNAYPHSRRFQGPGFPPLSGWLSSALSMAETGMSGRCAHTAKETQFPKPTRLWREFLAGSTALLRLSKIKISNHSRKALSRISSEGSSI